MGSRKKIILPVNIIVVRQVMRRALCNMAWFVIAWKVDPTLYFTWRWRPVQFKSSSSTSKLLVVHGHADFTSAFVAFCDLVTLAFDWAFDQAGLVLENMMICIVNSLLILKLWNLLRKLRSEFCRPRCEKWWQTLRGLSGPSGPGLAQKLTCGPCHLLSTLIQPTV